LAALGIEPLGALDRIPSLVERREYQKVGQNAENEISDLIERAAGAI
jgi:hypothetical protein